MRFREFFDFSWPVVPKKQTQTQKVRKAIADRPLKHSYNKKLGNFDIYDAGDGRYYFKGEDGNVYRKKLGKYQRFNFRRGKWHQA